MGIKALTPILKKYCKVDGIDYDEAPFNVSISSSNPDFPLLCHRMAVDMGTLFFICGSEAQRYTIDYANSNDEVNLNKDVFFNTILEKILVHIMKIFKVGVIPVLVFDGTAPVEKDNTLSNRYKYSDKNRDKIIELSIEYGECEVFDADRKSDIMQELRKAQMNNYYIDSKNKQKLFDTLTSLGLICIQALGESDFVCSSLLHNGYVSSVYSRDSDMLAAGCALVFNKLDFARGEVTFVGKRLDYILDLLQLDYYEFLDFCILSGTDFNNNLKGVGPVRSYDIIKKFRSINKYAKKNPTKDISCLNYDTVLDFFTNTDLPSKISEESYHYLENMFINVKADFNSVLNENNLSNLAFDFENYVINGCPDPIEDQMVDNIIYF